MTSDPLYFDIVHLKTIFSYSYFNSNSNVFVMFNNIPKTGMFFQLICKKNKLLMKNYKCLFRKIMARY